MSKSTTKTATTTKAQLKASVAKIAKEVVTLAELARALEREEKVVRAKFRRLYVDGGKGLPKRVGDGWTFAKADAKVVRELITTDHRLAAAE